MDFEHGLNAAVNRLRECLRDDADKPRYIETLPRRGYRFVAAIDGSRGAVDRSEPVAPLAQPAQTNGAEVVVPVKHHKWVTRAVAFAMLIVLAAAGLRVYILLHRPTATPFQKFSITQVTNTGKAARAAISPDGRYVLSVMDDNGTESLWLRNVATGNDTQVVLPSASHYESLTFSPDGNYICFRKLKSANAPCCGLYLLPMLGGSPHLVAENAYSDITFSPGGRRIAYIRWDAFEAGNYSIVTASLEGENEAVLHTESGIAERPLPNLAWSPRSNEISFPVYSIGPEGGSVGAIDTVGVRSHELHRFATFKRKFIDEIRWSPDGQVLLAVYRQTGENWSRAQIGFLRRTATDIEPITRDTNRYRTLTVSADGRTLATVLARSYSTVDVLAKAGREFAQARPLLSQSNEFDEWGWLNWSAEGNLLVSNTGRLFKLSADGKSQTQLLADSGALIVKPSPCGANYIVLTWTFHGGTNVPGIWRTNADGSGPLKLTDGRFDFYPVCSPDQKWVYYIDFSDYHISRVPLNGSGTVEPIFQGYAPVGGFTISPDGKTLAVAVAGGQTTKVSGEGPSIAVLELGSTSPPRMLPAKHYADDIYGNATLRFTPDGKSVAYVSRENGADNVWVQPLDGSAAYPITDFNSEQIWSFSLSPDGKSLAVLRGHFDSDVVLLQESRL